MSEYVFPEIKIFFIAIAVGAAVLYGYNLLVILRMVIRHAKAIIIIEDILYWIAAALIVFRIMFNISNGTLRIGFILGAAVGMLICNYSIIKSLKKLVVRITIRLKNKSTKGAEAFGGKNVSKKKKKSRT